MTTVQEIYAAIDRFAPFSLAESWDNSGFLVGNPDQPVTRILLALDITDAVINEAKELDAPLIVSHHPVIFHAVKQLKSTDIPCRLIAENMSAICAHTNLDIAAGGANDCLATVLGLTRIDHLEMTGDNLSLGRIGQLNRECTPEAFAVFVKERLGGGGVRFSDTHNPIRRVAVCGGSGGDLLDTAIAKGADALVTGDVKHDVMLAAIHKGITVVDSGHFATETVVLPYLKKELREKFPDIPVSIAKNNTDPVRFV